jgi:hypothetical protein
MAQEQFMKCKPQLYIIVEGGVVQSIESDKPDFFDGVNVLVIDCDTDGCDPIHLDTFEDGGGCFSAHSEDWTVEASAIVCHDQHKDTEGGVA